MPHGRRHRLSRFSLCVLAALTGAAHADATLEQAEQLLAKQQGQAAYALLAPLEDERGGEPAFDLLIGRAAMASGRHTEAAFAFERCLAIDPKHGPCRMQMAQAHMLLGETQQARSELQTIQEYNPPPEVASLVSQYMGMLQQQEDQTQRQINAYAQLGLGHDSNVNSATDESQIAIPTPLGTFPFVLDPSGQEQDDNFAQLEAGLRLRQTLSPAWSLLADAAVNQRLYQDLDDFNALALDVGAGGAWHAGPNQVILKATAQSYQLDGEDFRQLIGGMAQYLYSPRDSSQLSTFLQSTAISYDTQPFRDARRDTLGAAWSQAINWWRQPVVYAGLYGGQEDPKESGAKRFGQKFVGLRLGGSVYFGTRTQLTAALSAEDRQFDAEDPIFQATREDTQLDLSLGLGYRISEHLSLRPNYSFTSNDSNIVLNDFTRHTLSVDIRYER